LFGRRFYRRVIGIDDAGSGQHRTRLGELLPVCRSQRQFDVALDDLFEATLGCPVIGFESEQLPVQLDGTALLGKRQVIFLDGQPSANQQLSYLGLQRYLRLVDSRRLLFLLRLLFLSG
jgi:hypothetical protein